MQCEYQLADISSDFIENFSSAKCALFLQEKTCLAQVASSENDFLFFIQLRSEASRSFFFQPVRLNHMRQEVAFPASAAPLDLYDVLSERFKMATQYRLLLDGQPLANDVSLSDQGIAEDSVIELDPVRPCRIQDLWPDCSSAEDTLFLFSSQSAFDLLRADISDEQQLILETIRLALFGALQDIVGPTSGQHRTVLQFDRDIHRRIPFLQCNEVVRRSCWAVDTLANSASINQERSAKQLMVNGQLVPSQISMGALGANENGLITVAPSKVVLRTKKRFRLHRLPKNSTSSDLFALVQSSSDPSDAVTLTLDNCVVTTADEERPLNLEEMSVIDVSKRETKIEIELLGRRFECGFLQPRVKFTELVVEMARQEELPQRWFFQKALFCRGCGRRVTRDEEKFQEIPSDCCRVRSLQLSDRRVKGEDASNVCCDWS